MPLDSPIIFLAGLMEMVLPGKTVRLCDGGFIDWPARGLFVSFDEDYGTIGAVEPVGEAIADEAPGGRFTLLPPDGTSAADLFQPEAQGSPVKFWLAEVDGAAGTITGTPELLFDGMVDTLALRLERGGRSIDVEFVSAADRLFFIAEGNVLSPRFHKAVWPGELGLDHATGATVAVPWGTLGPSRGTTILSGGGGIAGGFLSDAISKALTP